MSKSRQLREPIDKKDFEIPDDHNYCRKCRKIRLNDNFGKAVDLELDSGGRLSFCKDCVDLMYEKILMVENGSIQRTVLRLCKKLNIRYDERAIESAITHIQSKKSNPLKLFGLYRAKLLVILRDSVNDTSVDLSYQYDDGVFIKKEENILSDNAFEEAKDLKKFWRIEDKDELEFLENEFSNFKKTHKADTHAEIILLKEICYKLLDMDKDRKTGKSTDASLKQLMSVMEKSLISPNMVSAANSGENLDTFGAWIADIEKEEPAQWLENEGHELYKDVDNIEDYFQKYFVRPLRNFILQAKDWNIDDEGLDDDDGDIFSDKADGVEDDKPEQLSE